MMNWLLLLKKVNDVQIIDSTGLLEKTKYNTKIDDIEKQIANHDIYVATPEFNKLNER